jgi:hypothetical protein
MVRACQKRPLASPVRARRRPGRPGTATLLFRTDGGSTRLVRGQCLRSGRRHRQGQSRDAARGAAHYPAALYRGDAVPVVLPGRSDHDLPVVHRAAHRRPGRRAACGLRRQHGMGSWRSACPGGMGPDSDRRGHRTPAQGRAGWRRRTGPAGAEPASGATNRHRHWLARRPGSAAGGRQVRARSYCCRTETADQRFRGHSAGHTGAQRGEEDGT